MENQDKKRQLIIDAALVRFAHYGLSKTTMTDIAKDISFSKALLYYYFPDKLSLYVSVIEYLLLTVSKDVIKSIEKTKTATDGILTLLQKRQGYIQKYYTLMEFSKLAGPDLPADLGEKFSKARAFELRIIASLLSRGVTTAEFVIDDVQTTTEIFIDALLGIHHNILNKDRNICPSKDQFKQIFIKEKKFAEIFLAGLKPR
ncbi:MAG: regulatory protein TetR [Pedobacter sp.]|jgi:TetR/AcrR family transcriptional regulator|nr:regulatory protein TetR [Pedobacter sp.]